MNPVPGKGGGFQLAANTVAAEDGKERVDRAVDLVHFAGLRQVHPQQSGPLLCIFFARKGS
jgi:hypothetical protein